MRRSSIVILTAIAVLLAATLVIWSAAIAEERGGVLTVSFLDVGQGDAIFIESPSGVQVLIDGGSGSAVLAELGTRLPWYDRSLDLVMATHPDADHAGGLIEVLGRYTVDLVVESSVESDTELSAAFRTAADRAGAARLVAERGQVIELGGGARLEILYPDRRVPAIPTNTGCVVARLVYGETAFMLPCDAPKEVEAYLVALDGTKLHAQVLKAGHHGSNTSSADSFIGSVDPAYAVFSRGCDNRYGHPHPEIVARYERFGIATLDTCEAGTITFVSDGSNVAMP